MILDRYAILPILMLLAISERIFSLDIAGLRLSFGDICLLATPFILGLNTKLKLSVYIFVAGLSLAILMHGYLLSGFISINSTISLPVKVLISCQIYALLEGRVRFVSFGFVRFLFLALTLCLLLFAEDNRFTSIEILNDNEGVHYLLTIAIFIAFFDYYSGRHSSFSIIAIFCLLLISITAFSRQGILLSLIIIFLMSWKSFGLFAKTTLLGMVGVTVFSITVYLSAITSATYAVRRLQSVFGIGTVTRADTHRFENILFGFEGFLDSPIVGNGVRSFVYNNELHLVAHNTFVTIMYEFGLLGIVPLLFYVFRLVVPYLRLPSKNDLNLLFLCSALVAFVAQLFTIETTSRSTIFIVVPMALFLIKNIGSSNEKCSDAVVAKRR